MNQSSISEAALWMSPTILLKSKGKKVDFLPPKIRIAMKCWNKSEFTIIAVSKEYILSTYHNFQTFPQS